jgi:hypothetical protein
VGGGWQAAGAIRSQWKLRSGPKSQVRSNQTTVEDAVDVFVPPLVPRKAKKLVLLTSFLGAENVKFWSKKLRNLDLGWHGPCRSHLLVSDPLPSRARELSDTTDHRVGSLQPLPACSHRSVGLWLSAAVARTGCLLRCCRVPDRILYPNRACERVAQLPGLLSSANMLQLRDDHVITFVESTILPSRLPSRR